MSTNLLRTLVPITGAVYVLAGIQSGSTMMLMIGATAFGVPMLFTGVENSKWHKQLEGYRNTRKLETELGLERWRFGDSLREEEAIARALGEDKTEDGAWDGQAAHLPATQVRQPNHARDVGPNVALTELNYDWHCKCVGDEKRLVGLPQTKAQKIIEKEKDYAFARGGSGVLGGGEPDEEY